MVMKVLEEKAAAAQKGDPEHVNIHPEHVNIHPEHVNIVELSHELNTPSNVLEQQSPASPGRTTSLAGGLLTQVPFHIPVYIHASKPCYNV